MTKLLFVGFVKGVPLRMYARRFASAFSTQYRRLMDRRTLHDHIYGALYKCVARVANSWLHLTWCNFADTMCKQWLIYGIIPLTTLVGKL